MSASVLGLDVGNDTSVIAAAKHRGVDVLLNDESKRETPSAVSFSPSQRLLGSAAITSSLSTISHIKRLLASSVPPSDLPFPTSISPSDGQILVHVTHRGSPRQFSAVQLLAMLLSYLRSLASRSLGPVSECVIGVPVYFTDTQRRAYLDAANVAGLRPLRLMHEGAAIALGYGIYRADATSTWGTVVFVDVGHCGTQVSIARFEPGKVTMLAYAFDRDLGGRDFDEVLFRHFAGQFREQHGIDVLGNAKASMRLRDACEKVKKVLSANAEAQLNVECLMEEIDVKGLIKRDEFKGLSEVLLERIVVCCQKAMEDAGLEVDDVYSVELVGSGSRIPAISKRLAEFFLREPSRTLNASECIARGCALQCAMLSPIFRVRPYEVQDSFPFSVGFFTDKDLGSTSPGCILKKGHPIPSDKILIFRRSKTFDIEAVYAVSDELPAGASQMISCSTIGPFEVSNARVRVKVKVSFDLHGILRIESASLIEDDTYKPTSRSMPGPNSNFVDSEFYSGSSDEVNVIANGSLAEWDTTGNSDGQNPSLDNNTTKHGKVSRRRNLEVTQRIYGKVTEDKLAEFKSIEEDLAEKDRIVEEIKDKKNTLEAYVYETRNKLSDVYRSFASESEKQEITDNLRRIEDWLYDDGDDESIQVYSDKLNELEKLVIPIERRCKDEEARAQAIKELFACIVELRKVEKSALPTYIINEVVSECQQAENWLREKGKQQDVMPKNADPVLWSEEIVKKTEDLRKTCHQIIRSKTSPRPDDRKSVGRTYSEDDMDED